MMSKAHWLGEAGKPQNEGLYHLLIGPLFWQFTLQVQKFKSQKKKGFFTVINKIVVHELDVKALM
jgi:hypothetical protein